MARLDHYIKGRFPGLRGRLVDEAIHSGLILVGGERAHKGDIPKARVDVTRLETHLTKLRQGKPLDISVVADEGDFVVIDKPEGIPSHPIGLFDDKTVTAWAMCRYPEVSKEFVECQPTVTPHRLDTGTRGLLIVCKTKRVFDLWRKRFTNHEVTKVYVATCVGECRKKNFTLKSWLSRDPKNKKRMTVLNKKREGARFAETDFEVLESAHNRCRLRATTRYGVTHQIRVQLASVGLPLLGDVLYGGEKADRPHHDLVATELNFGGRKWRT